MDERIVEREEREMVGHLMSRGRHAAALDGSHLIIWGVCSAIALSLQYFAEVYDWALSNDLWLWQPMLIIGFVVSMFVAKSGAGRRLGNPVSKAYASAFAAAGFTIGSFLIVSGLGGRPEPLAAAVLLSGVMSVAFFVLASVTEFRWMFVPAFGWWAIMIFYAQRGVMIPADFIVLSLAALFFLALPGARLAWERNQ